MGNEQSRPSRPLGLSVHYLNGKFLDEMKRKGYDVSKVTAKLLEPNLKSPQMGFIRKKGQNVRCPRDNEKGAAFVDCLEGKDNVGPSDAMLSYTWGDSLRNIVKTLLQECLERGLDPKRTYIWICCLCNNQHRVHQKRISGTGTVSFDEFHGIFKSTLLSIGVVLSYMSPWRNPKYMTRIWCILEIYLANTHEGVISKIIMPASEREDMISSIGKDFDLLLSVLSKTRIEDATASVAQDKEDILTMVREDIGYRELNVRVNVVLREWIMKVLLSAAGENEDPTDDAAFARKLETIAIALGDMGENQHALSLHKKALAIREVAFGVDSTQAAGSYNSIGLVLYDMAEYKEALLMHNKALKIFEVAYGTNSTITANSYNNIGNVLSKMAEYKEALVMYNKALKIREVAYGTNSTITAQTYRNIGLALEQMGEMKEALSNFQKCLSIRVKVLGEDDPRTRTVREDIKRIDGG